jgi:WD40 repeat protein
MLAPTDAAPIQPDQAVTFISYAREDKAFVLRLAEALQLKEVRVSGDWQLVRGEDYNQQLEQLQLGADAVIFILSPDSVRSLPCRTELDRAVEQAKRILPVVYRDVGDEAGAVAPALALPQWTFLRADDDFVGGVQGLVEAVNTDFELLPQHRRLLQGAETWQRNQRSPSYLLRKDGLKRAEDWLVQTGRFTNKLPKPTPLELDYIRASQSARTRGTRVGSVVVAIIAGVLAVLAVVAWVQRNEAKKQASIAQEKSRIAQIETDKAKVSESHAQTEKKAADESRMVAEKRREEAEQATETERAARAVDLAGQPGREIEALSIAVQAAGAAKRRPFVALRPAVIEGLAAAVAAASYSLPLSSHADEVDSAAFSPDGRRLLTKSKDRTARLWDTADGRLVASFPLNSSYTSAHVSAASFSCDSRKVVTPLGNPGRQDEKTAQIWDAQSGKALVTLKGHTGPVNSAFFSPDSTQVVTASSDRTARVWTANGDLVRTWQAPSNTVWGNVHIALFSPDSARVLTTHQDGQSRVWNVSNGNLLEAERAGPFASDAFSPASRFLIDDRMLVAVVGTSCVFRGSQTSPDGALVLRKEGKRPALSDARTGKAVQPVYGQFGGENDAHTGDINFLGFSPDGHQVVSGSQDDTARLWDAKTGALSGILKGHTDRVWYAGFAPDNRTVVTASADRSARLWNTRVDRSLLTLGDESKRVDSEPRKNDVYSAEFSPDGRTVVTAHGDGSARLWDVASGRLQTSLQASGPVYQAAFSPDGSRITAATEAHVLLWDARTKQPVATVQGSGHLDTSERHKPTDFSREGDRLLTIDKESWMIWDTRTGKPAKRGAIHEPRSVALSPTGRQVALVNTYGGDVDLVDLQTGKSKGLVHGARLDNFVGFSPNGSRIVTPCAVNASQAAFSDYAAQVYDTQNGKVVAVFRGHSGKVLSAAFSPDGARLVTASEDRTARIWDAASAKHLATLSGHTGEVWYAKFSPDGTQVLTLGGDHEAWLWDSASGHRLATLQGHSGTIHSTAFSRDGSRIVTAGADGLAKIYSAVTSELTTEYLSKAFRLLRQQALEFEQVRDLEPYLRPGVATHPSRSH